MNRLIQLIARDPRRRAIIQHYLRRFPFLDRAARRAISGLSLAQMKPATRGLQPFRPDRQTIVLCAHEASRSGAPILALNLAQQLGKRFNIICLLLRGGELVGEFEACSFKVICPRAGSIAAASPKTIAKRILNPIKKNHGIDFVIVNSVEAGVVADASFIMGIPTVSLVHEFAEYVNPSRIMRIIDHSNALVFSSELLADSMRKASFQSIEHAIVLPQGRSVVPPLAKGHDAAPRFVEIVAEHERKPTFLCIGCGYVQPRKGVDIFIMVASSILRAIGREKVRFLWVGDGYSPDWDFHHSVWLKDQIARSGLEGSLEIIPAVGPEELELLYRKADVMFLSSRLDPFPNVAIDALHAGVPIVSMEKASGIAEYLARFDETKPLVVPYLDVGAAADAILRLEADTELRRSLSAFSKSIAARDFDMRHYADRLVGLLDDVKSSAEQEARDAATILETGLFCKSMFRERSSDPVSIEEAVRTYVRHSAARAVEGLRPARRPILGFSPHIFRDQAMADDAPGDKNPAAEWIRQGRPDGPWAHAVIDHGADAREPVSSDYRVALQLHLHYPELIEDLMPRLEVNRIRPDLLISTTSAEKAAFLSRRLADYHGALVDVRIVPNRGRDIGAMLTEFGESLKSYDVVGHLHGKRSLELKRNDPAGMTGEIWREFLMQNLVGARYAALDGIVTAFERDAGLGLVFPEDPVCVGWTDNYEEARRVAARIGLPSDLPRTIEFPVGNMFYARPAAIARLLDAGLAWDDYPAEPVAYDATMLHAIERLTPIVCEKAGFRWMTTYAPGCTR